MSMLRFLQYINEGLKPDEVKVPEPDVEDDGYEVYTYPTEHDILQVGIGPNEDGAHHVWFTHGGSFGRALDVKDPKVEVKKDPGFTMGLLSRVAATLKHHSASKKATDYTYETANKTRDKIYQRISKAAGVVARNLMPADHMFDRHEPVENWPSYMRPERLDEDMPFVMDVGERRPRFDYSPKPNVPAILGKIGPYKVMHHPHHGEAESEAISIIHRDKQVGVVPIERYKGRISPSYPMVAPGHSSKRARVKNLVPKVYAMIADKLGTVESGSEQTPGSRSVWARLARMRDVQIKGPKSKPKPIITYTHPDYARASVDASRFDYYSRRYRSMMSYTRTATRTPGERGRNFGRHASDVMRELRSALHRSGVARGKVVSMKKAEHFPHPRTFKKITTKVEPVQGRYSPQKHDDTVYHPTRGGDYTLLLPGRKKTRKKRSR